MKKSPAKLPFPLKKRYGQHLLISPRTLEEIVDRADIKKTDSVIEIGSGDGALTALLASRAKKVISVEIDKRFKPIHKKRLKTFKNLEIIYGDFLKISLEETVCLKNLSNIKFVGNIPYNITAPLIMKILESSVIFKGLYFTLQKEVAERLVAPPGKKAYGVFGIKVNYFSTPNIEFSIPRSNFFPVPKVDSAFVSIIPRKKPFLGAEKERKEFFKFIDNAFAHRRKTLINSLKYDRNKPLPEEEIKNFLKKMGKPTNIRAEALSLEELLALYLELQ